MTTLGIVDTGIYSCDKWEWLFEISWDGELFELSYRIGQFSWSASVWPNEKRNAKVTTIYYTGGWCDTLKIRHIKIFSQSRVFGTL